MVKRYLSEEDQRLWDQFVSGIKPLSPAHGTRRLGNQVAMPSETPRIEVIVGTKPLPKPPSARDLKNVHIHGRLDLHGMSQDQAYSRIISFIERAHRTQKRCVLIITGKGLGESNHWWEERGVLKQQVPRWLMEDPLRSLITTFTNARPEHGGAGAIYVFLRRR